MFTTYIIPQQIHQFISNFENHQLFISLESRTYATTLGLIEISLNAFLSFLDSSNIHSFTACQINNHEVFIDNIIKRHPITPPISLVSGEMDTSELAMEQNLLDLFQ